MYFAHPIDFICLTNFEKKNKTKTKIKQKEKTKNKNKKQKTKPKNKPTKKKKKKKHEFIRYGFFFGVSPDSYLRHFGTINK